MISTSTYAWILIPLVLIAFGLLGYAHAYFSAKRIKRLRAELESVKNHDANQVNDIDIDRRPSRSLLSSRPRIETSPRQREIAQDAMLVSSFIEYMRFSKKRISVEIGIDRIITGVLLVISWILLIKYGELISLEKFLPSQLLK